MSVEDKDGTQEPSPQVDTDRVDAPADEASATETQGADSSGVAAAAGVGGFFKQMLALPNDSPKKTLFVAVSMCVVCSILVSGAAVLLKPTQTVNKALDRKRNILEVAGMLDAGADVESAFKDIEVRVVDLDTGDFTDTIDAARYDARKAARDPSMSEVVPAGKDIAGIGRRARYAHVYLVREGETIKQVILPVQGYGLWSTLYGFLSLEGDLNTVVGLRFYEHAETPGLGGEVDNPSWRMKWDGKMVYDDQGEVRLGVLKGNVDPSQPDAKYKVDGLAGATLTSRGVSNLLQYWLGEQAFGPFLEKLRTREG